MIKRKERANAVLTELARLNPQPQTELNFETPWQLLVAVVLSAQSTDKQVNKVTTLLFAKYPTPESMASLTPDELAEEIRNVGLFRTKSKHLVATANALVNEYNGNVPQSLAQLESLPGVGRKTANVVLSTAFDIPALAVDTHVFRVANRLGLAKAKTPEETERQLVKAIPKKLWSKAHHWLILHGRYTCTARKPKCPACPVNSYCLHYHTK